MIAQPTLYKHGENNVINQQLVRTIIVWCKFEYLKAIGKGTPKKVG